VRPFIPEVRWGSHPAVVDAVQIEEWAVTHDDREECMADAQNTLEPGASCAFWIACFVTCDPADFVPRAHDLIEQMSQNVADVVGGDGDDFEVKPGASEALTAALAAWAREHGFVTRHKIVGTPERVTLTGAPLPPRIA